MICPQYITTGLETAFARIQRERMADMPLLNPALEVKAVGFIEWEDHCLGVLITPWFMNLMLIPREGDEWAEMPSGTKIHHQFPSGHYEFILGEEEGIGRYQMCSLFSPVFEFQSQEAAVATAEAVMQGLMDENNRLDKATAGGQARDIDAGRGDETPPSLTQRIDKPMSRRELLRGAFLGSKA